MNDPLNQSRIDEPRTGILPAAALNDWNPADVELPPPESVLRRERVFPPHVLIGWALFALCAYFGVKFVGSVIETSVKEAINAASVEVAGSGGNSPTKQIIYQTPNGKITITRDHAGGPIRIIRRSPTRAHPDGPADARAAAEAAKDAVEAAAEAAAAATATIGTAVPAPKAPPAPTKR